jgi:ribosomal-protein-alanine N-acetyltransferase
VTGGDPFAAVVRGHLRSGATIATVGEIDAGRLVLRPIGSETARALLSGQIPAELVLAPDYPSQFSLEVMDLVAGPRSEGLHHFGPFFMVRRGDGAVIGEIGALLELATRTAQVGYSVVKSCWGQGYATEAVKALLRELAVRQDVDRIVAETMVTHGASRRVMEKAGMRECGRRIGEEDGVAVELVGYEFFR